MEIKVLGPGCPKCQQVEKIVDVDVEGQRRWTDLAFALGPGVVEQDAVLPFEIQDLWAPVHSGLGGAVEKDDGGSLRFGTEGFEIEAATVFGLEVRHRSHSAEANSESIYPKECGDAPELPII